MVSKNAGNFNISVSLHFIKKTFNFDNTPPERRIGIGFNSNTVFLKHLRFSWKWFKNFSIFHRDNVLCYQYENDFYVT